MSRARWPVLAVCLLGIAESLLIPVLVGKILDLSGSFPAVFSARGLRGPGARVRRLHPGDGAASTPVMVA